MVKVIGVYVDSFFNVVLQLNYHLSAIWGQRLLARPKKKKTPNGSKEIGNKANRREEL